MDSRFKRPVYIKMTFALALFTILLVQSTKSANILVIHAFYSGSPVLTWRAAADYFTQHGHKVHVLRWKDTHHHPPTINPNITETVLAMDNSAGRWSMLTKEKEAAFDIPVDMLMNEGMSYWKISWEGLKGYYPMSYSACDTLLSNKLLLKKLRKMHFDLAIVDLVANECALALAHHLGLITVGFWGMQFASIEATMTVAFLPPSHAPNLLSKLTDQMTFPQRMYNLLMYIGSQVVVRSYCTMLQIPIQTHMPGTPNPCTLLTELNGMLINSDHVMDYPQLLPPTFVRVGGLHIRDPKKLPEDIDQWMESSGDDGVVVFAVMSTKVLSKKFMNSFMRAVSKLPQKFLMKLDGHFDFIPANVKVLKWIPQQDVLAHNKTRLFVTHCGLQGVTESIYFGVPMVGMPIFLDQGDYLVKMETHGVAIGLDRHTATTQDIYYTMHRVLHDPKFKENTQRLSHLMKDTKESSRARALDLVEYLIRHKGASHLKLASRHLNFIQYFCLDLILAFILITYLSYKICRIVLRKCILLLRNYTVTPNNSTVTTGNKKEKLL